MAVGMKEIAKDLNLGLSTVAQSLQGKGTVSSQTRRLVVEYAAKVGYMPNRNAQRMRSSRTGVIGLIVPDVVLSPYVEVVQHLFQAVETQGRELQIALTEFDWSLENRAFKNMLASRVDGIIAKVGFSTWEEIPADHSLRWAKTEGVPLVLYSNPIEGVDFPYLKHQHGPSSRLIIQHLLQLGHRRIAALVPAVHPFGPAMRIWLAAIQEELASYGAAVQLEVVGLAVGEVDKEGPLGVFRDYINQNHPQYAVPAGRELFRSAKTLASQPTAMLAYSDAVAIGAIFEAQAHGLKVGREIAIAGSGQMPSSFLCPMTLTTVDRQPQLYAQKLLHLLLAHMDPAERARAPQSEEVTPLLVVGQSTMGV